MNNASTADTRNNARLDELITATQLSLATAITLFNRGRSSPAKESDFKAWLATPAAERWAPLSDADLAHAEAVFAPLAKPTGFNPNEARSAFI